MTTRPAASRPLAARAALAAALALLMTALLMLSCTQPALAGSLEIGADGSSATVAAPLSVRYRAADMKNAMWNHGSFHVYFFQGASGVETRLVKRRGSDIKTSQVSLKFSRGVSWAKVHVAAVDASSPSNGGKSKRLKSDSGANLSMSTWLRQGRKFYVWISETGGDCGSISLRGTKTIGAVYANGSTFKNVQAITVTSQPASDHTTLGETESDFDSILNIPLRWEGKEASQVPFHAINCRGVGNNSSYHSFYRMNWRQYSSGTTYSGYSPYKLRHGTTSASNLWTSVNLASIGITTAPTYTDESLQIETGDVYRNTDSSILCCLRRPKEQLKLDTDGGVLKKGGASYSGSAVNYKRGYCDSTASLPKEGFKKGRDGSSEGYELAGYSWKSGTRRGSFDAGAPTSSAGFAAFDQAAPQQLTLDSPTVSLCNSWQMPSFGPDNLADGKNAPLKPPSVATVTYRAQWKALPFTIHYIVNGTEVDSEMLPYDSPYSLKGAPSGSGGWSVRTQDGASAPASGYMPAQDIFASADTPAENTVRYFVDGKLVASYTLPFGSEPLATTYVDSSAGGIEYNDDGVWHTESCSFTASYKEHYNVPKQVPCEHYVEDWLWVNGYWVNVPTTVIVDGKPVTQNIYYYVSGYYVDNGYYEHSYDLQDDYSPYNTLSYSSSFDVPGNPHGGSWHGWFEDSSLSTPAASSYSLGPGGSLSFYSYTTHKLSYIVNGSTRLEEERRYGETINPYSNGEELNGFGGELERWFSDESCTAPWGKTVTVGADDLAFYGCTRHSIHFWMDAGKKVPQAGDQQEAGDADEEADTGSTDDDPEELAYCRHEMSLRYGEALELPSGAAASAQLTRPGCEDWASSNGRWFSDAACSVPASGGTCLGDAVFYSYNVVRLSYALSSSAEQLDESRDLFDQASSKPVSLKSYLPAPALYRYGERITPSGDGSVCWSTSAGLTRRASSVKGVFLNKGASGKALEELTLNRSLIAYKHWAQKAFDGIVTN